MSSRAKSRLLALLLILLTVTTRFIKLDWGNGFLFHPDENNMAIAISRFSSNNLNPHFFAYGQFPLYLVYFSLVLFRFSNNLFTSILMLRCWSAIFSCFTVLVFYLISKFLFKKKLTRLIFILFLIFNPGLIQLSHFGTTESLLLFVFTLNIFLSIKFLKNPKLKYLLFSSLFTGIGFATKITSVFFTIPIFLSLAFVYLKPFKPLHLLFYSFSYLAVSFLLFLSLSPYNLIEFQNFKSTMLYETAVATGSQKVFYTSQFIGSTPYLFQITKIFPYVSGLSIFIFSLIGLFYLKKINRQILVLIFLPSLVYFIYFGQLYAKWTRFMSPLFFIFPLLAAVFMSRIKSQKLVFLLSVISIFPGIFFLNLYLHPDIRLTASGWINQNIPGNSIVLSEAGNVINLPITDNQLQVMNFDFYNLDKNINLIQDLPTKISQSEYIIIPSRRIFKNQNNSKFPVSQKYYQNLFNGNLGFSEIKKFEIKSGIFLNPESTEETFSVFDQPTIRIFKKNTPLSVEDYATLLKI
ncbi:MAG: glycosyltransferase family 39 protein [Candidatus Shapirobacteria bacterium]